MAGAGVEPRGAAPEAWPAVRLAEVAGEAAEWIAALAAVAAVVGPGVSEGLIEEASLIMGGLAWEVGLGDWAADAYDVTGPVEVDALGLVECLGAEGLADVVAWAVGALAGDPVSPPPALGVLAECAGWSVDPGRLPRGLAAAAALVTVNAALHQRG